MIIINKYNIFLHLIYVYESIILIYYKRINKIYYVV